MEEVLTLECVWKTDKFVLKETASKCEMEHQDGSLEGRKAPAGKSVRYQSIEAFLGGKVVISVLFPLSNLFSLFNYLLRCICGIALLQRHLS